MTSGQADAIDTNGGGRCGVATEVSASLGRSVPTHQQKKWQSQEFEMGSADSNNVSPLTTTPTPTPRDNSASYAATRST